MADISPDSGTRLKLATIEVVDLSAQHLDGWFDLDDFTPVRPDDFWLQHRLFVQHGSGPGFEEYVCFAVTPIALAREVEKESASQGVIPAVIEGSNLLILGSFNAAVLRKHIEEYLEQNSGLPLELQRLYLSKIAESECEGTEFAPGRVAWDEPEN
jgi:hypothetical protein